MGPHGTEESKKKVSTDFVAASIHVQQCRADTACFFGLLPVVGPALA